MESEKIHIFRCAAMPLNYLQTRKIPDTKKHYVALCQPAVISSGQRHFKPVLPNVDIPVLDEIISLPLVPCVCVSFAPLGKHLHSGLNIY